MKTPSDKQIKFADRIAATLEIDFPKSSDDFTAATYYNFIKNHIDEYNKQKRYIRADFQLENDIFWGYEYGLWEY